ncbi:MAG: AbrB/MazE/SpoVT family DNA-binding domain-containing protein [Candidatus Parabeggiatoa sp. nov. 3]|nr:MAG: AbrB/MazE/SpoVT family DNA-binding domain-containing protein [Gammaproteobacteria bacterium]RKZ54728.1 MAG: AbrB/MazE/SpoVT family DNA-binding domain-containing protein [Gammaproteobacteria bacterium]
MLEPETVYLSDTGQLSISQKLRNQLEWKSGMKLAIILVDKGLLVKPIPSKGKHRLESLRGFFKPEGIPISDEVLFAPVDYNESKNIT